MMNPEIRLASIPIGVPQEIELGTSESWFLDCVANVSEGDAEDLDSENTVQLPPGGHLTLKKSTDDRGHFQIHVEGKFTAQLPLLCSRCGATHAHLTKPEVHQVFSTDPELKTFKADKEWDPEEFTDISQFLEQPEILDGHILDLRSIVTEHLLLEIPPQPLCRNDCKGLCDECGADQNLKTCDHGKSEQPFKESPFAALAGLFPDKASE